MTTVGPKVQEAPIESEHACILTINGGSSSIKFGLFSIHDSLRRILHGEISGIGMSQAMLRVDGPLPGDQLSRIVRSADHGAAAETLMNYVEDRVPRDALAAVGHRVVHGGPTYSAPEHISAAMIEALRGLSPFDPEHLPEELQLIDAVSHRFSGVPQVACFDTAFHHIMPRVAQLLPIPRRYEAQGIRRYGFHGLSYAFLMEELARVAGEEAALGRVILAHLGSGASLAAVRDGKSVDTSMGLTPAAGVPMSTRSGDLDPGLAWHLARTEGMTPKLFNKMVNVDSGLLGMSETSPDMHDLIGREAHDVRAAEAVAVFCYQVKKWIGAFAAAMGGVDTLVFSGGIGENAPTVRARICEDLDFLGIALDPLRNEQNARLSSPDDGGVPVWVMRTNEALMIAKSVMAVLDGTLRSSTMVARSSIHTRNQRKEPDGTNS